MNDISVKLRGVYIHSANRIPLVILDTIDVSPKKSIIIWISPFEAAAIMRGIDKIQVPRPLTHELLCNMLAKLSVQLEKIVVTDLIIEPQGGVYHATMYLKRGDETFEIDCRHSDALAFAMLNDCPIFVRDKVMDAANISIKTDTLEGDDFAEFLKSLDPEKAPHA